jgi:arylsulfatase A-like enzyme
MARNVLFIMCDQLRWDYLSATGHPHLHTPHIDRLAARGMLFDRCYTQSPICGPSRMSFYTGRYVSSHGSTWNNVPLKVGEMTIGDHLRPLGVRTALCGKTHMTADIEGMRRLGIAPDSEIGVLSSECGFEPWERDDGLHPHGGRYKPNEAYEAHMKAKGWTEENPWDDVANSGEDDDGNLLSGWFLDHSDKPARVADEDSETPYTVGRAMDFMREAGDTPWCLHLSLIKPHWPYIVPAPYHDMYPPETHLPVNRSEEERASAHPVFGAFMQERVSLAFTNDTTRSRVIGAYMGLVKQIDDQMGVLLDFLDNEGLSEDTLIVFTSDHGDYLGDHWMGEKELFHDPSARVPLIVVDPSPEADKTRGTKSDALIEAIDLAPTFLDWYGGEAKPHILEGHSLLPVLHGHTDKLRNVTISEYDYSMRGVRNRLGLAVRDARLTMVFDGRWKFIWAETFRPMLYDLLTDPNELVDLGADPAFEAERVRLERALFDWSRRQAQRVTISDTAIAARDASTAELRAGILIGYRNEAEYKEALETASTQPKS